MLNMNLQFFAHKKGVGSTKNGRDSESKRLGAKSGITAVHRILLSAGRLNGCDETVPAGGAGAA